MSESTLSTFLFSFLAGGLSGCAVDFALFPIDSLKTRIQAQRAGQQISYSNPYAGLLPNLAVSFPAAATFWATYRTVKHILDGAGLEQKPALKHLIAASCGSITTSCVRNPFELIKQQLQAQRFKTSSEACTYIYKNLGIGGFFVGLTSLIMREIPFDTLQFLVYERLKQEDYNGEKLSMYRHLLNGAVAGGFAAFVTTPIDAAKTRMMVYAGSDEYRNLYQVMFNMIKQEGVVAMWSSWKIRVLYTTIGGMLFFGTFEFVNGNINKQKIRK